MNSDTKENLK